MFEDDDHFSFRDDLLRRSVPAERTERKVATGEMALGKLSWDFRTRRTELRQDALGVDVTSSNVEGMVGDTRSTGEFRFGPAKPLLGEFRFGPAKPLLRRSVPAERTERKVATGEMALDKLSWNFRTRRTELRQDAQRLNENASKPFRASNLWTVDRMSNAIRTS